MKRVAQFFGKKVVRNAAIVLAIALVAYVVMYGVREGFQQGITTIKENELVRYANITSTNVSTYGMNLPKSAFPPGKTKLSGLRAYIWGEAMPIDGGKRWVQITPNMRSKPSQWDVITVGDPKNPRCNITKRNVDGDVASTDLAQCDFKASPNNSLTLSKLLGSIYIKMAARMTTWGRSYKTTPNGLQNESIPSANLAVVFTFE